MSKCESCMHKDACAAWIRHGETLYDDFAYTVENCPYYVPKCIACRHYGTTKHGMRKCDIFTEICGEGFFAPDADFFCGEGERRTE